MYSWFIISSIEERTIRAMIAAGGIAVVSAGRIRWLRRSKRPPSPRRSYIPCTGNHFNCTAKTITSPRPKTNVGMLAAISVAPIEARSNRESRRMAETKPTAMPSGIAMISAPPRRIALLRSRSPSSSDTGMLLENERPRSPWSARQSQLPYCTAIGWSRPEVVPELLDGLLRRQRTKKCLGDIAGHQLHGKKDHSGNTQQDRDRAEKSADDVASEHQMDPFRAWHASRKIDRASRLQVELPPRVRMRGTQSACAAWSSYITRVDTLQCKASIEPSLPRPSKDASRSRRPELRAR